MGEIIQGAIARQAARPEPKPIDYARMREVWPKQKGALTRAVKSGDPERVAKVCRDAVRVWDEVGAWPDDWSLFQRALDDALPWNVRIDLRDL
jgi:hypothetical protein